MCLIFGFVHHFTKFMIITPDGHLNSRYQNEGFSRSLDWSFTTYRNLPQPGLFVSLWILLEKRNVECEDICESDEDMESIEMNFWKEGTYYRK